MERVSSQAIIMPLLVVDDGSILTHCWCCRFQQYFRGHSNQLVAQRWRVYNGTAAAGLPRRTNALPAATAVAPSGCAACQGSHSAHTCRSGGPGNQKLAAGTGRKSQKRQRTSGPNEPPTAAAAAAAAAPSTAHDRRLLPPPPRHRARGGFFHRESAVLLRASAGRGMMAVAAWLLGSVGRGHV